MGSHIDGNKRSGEALHLAPGAVEGYRVGLLGTPAQRRELLRWLKPALAFSLTVAVCALAAGVMVARFVP